MSRLVRSTMMAMLIMICITFIYQPFFYSRLIFLYDIILTIVLLGLSRFVWGIVLGALRKRGVGVVRVLIVGAGEVGRTVIRTVMAQPEFGYQIAALVDDHVDSTTPMIGPVPALRRHAASAANCGREETSTKWWWPCPGRITNAFWKSFSCANSWASARAPCPICFS